MLQRARQSTMQIMRLDVSQHLRMQQEMRLSPRIIQAMEILQLPLAALQERIDEELQSNPVLEMREGGDEPSTAPEAPSVERGEQPMVVREEGSDDDFGRLDDFSNEYAHEDIEGLDVPRHAPIEDRDRKLDAMANAPAPGLTLTEHLMSQWAFVETNAQTRSAGELIINNISPDGYLRATLDEISVQTQPPTPLELLRPALRLVQTLDPIGVAARDLKECLLLQLSAEADGGADVSLEIQLVSYFLRDIEGNRLPQIARRTGKTLEQIKKAIAVISHLNPRPGLLVGEQASPIITPDIIVGYDDRGEIVVTLPDSTLPYLYVSKTYRKMARDRAADRQARQFVQKNIRSAEWLISAILQRQHTVKRVVEEVFAVQRDFLEAGPESLKPLPMGDVAARVGVHVATVSRAVAGKYVQTPCGIYPLRMFFSGGTTTSEGQDVAWDAIKAKLKEVVDAEDKAHPLNDDQIVKALGESGITIARRTIAKYRDLLGIPPARKRKAY